MITKEAFGQRFLEVWKLKETNVDKFNSEWMKLFDSTEGDMVYMLKLKKIKFEDGTSTVISMSSPLGQGKFDYLDVNSVATLLIDRLNALIPAMNNDNHMSGQIINKFAELNAKGGKNATDKKIHRSA